MPSFDQDKVRALLQEVVTAAVRVGERTGPTPVLFAAERALLQELGMAPFPVELLAPSVKLPVEEASCAGRSRVELSSSKFHSRKIIRIAPYACGLLYLDELAVRNEYKLTLLEKTQRGSSFSVEEGDLRRLRKAFFEAKSTDRSWEDRSKAPRAIDVTIAAIDRVLEGKPQ